MAAKAPAKAAPPKQKPLPTGKGKGKGKEEEETAAETAEDEWTNRPLLKPDDQLDLTEVELKEEITRILTANNPHAPQNIVRYSLKDCQYKPQGHIDQLAIHFQLEGNLLHKDSDEAKRQLTRSSGAPAEPAEAPKEGATQTKPEQAKSPEADDAKDDARDEETISPVAKKGEQKLTNQFNFTERAAQTYNNPTRERNYNTEPPPRETFSGNVSQWEIFDSYQEDFQRQQREKDKETKKATQTKKEDEKGKRKTMTAESLGTAADDWYKVSDDVARVVNSAKIVERMVNQNTFDDVAQDFKYWEDVSDDYRDQEGTLLPLWKFAYDPARKMAVTAVAWSQKYHDLFAVGNGSYDFTKQLSGMLLFYSLKNPSFPEYRYNTDVGVMSLDLHPTYPNLCVVGFYDGSVGVFNVTEKKSGPAYMSTSKTGKHTDPVWQVKWQKNDLDDNLNFFSCSSDGRIVQWTLIKNELMYYDVAKLSIIESSPQDGPDGARLPNLAAGTTFAFHPTMDYLFLVGTEEGKICKCSKAYGSQFLDVFQAHHMAIYKVAWNSYHPKVFATCSADWLVKIWDHTYPEPLFIYDLGAPVGDIAWAPYSSTIFAAVTNDGRVCVFDLNINKYEALCLQPVVQRKKTKLTHIAFNPIHPVIIVGDDRGAVSSLKLSPNLRKMPKEKKNEPNKKPEDVEIAKMDKILASVRENDKTQAAPAAGGAAPVAAAAPAAATAKKE